MASKSNKKASNKSKNNTVASLVQLKQYYKDMLLIRRFEEKATQLYGMGLIGGFCHLYIGQEAVVVGIQSALEEKDSVITTYRDHGHMLACGMDPKGVMAELTGRIDGYSKGKGGSMHMFSRDKNFYGGHGIVGTSASLGAGLAFAHKYKGDGGITTAYFGDGAANQGQLYETLNMASLWKLPIIFILENNKYAMGTSQKRHAAGDFCKRAESYDIPSMKVDGMDILAVRKAALEAVEHVRSGKGAMFLEIDTYRYRGHSMSDPATYRTKEELQCVKDNRDAIIRIKSLLIESGKYSEADLKAMDKEIKATIKEAAEFAKDSPEPDASELYTDILLEA